MKIRLVRFLFNQLYQKLIMKSDSQKNLQSYFCKDFSTNLNKLNPDKSKRIYI